MCILKCFLVEVSKENLAEYIHVVGQRRSLLVVFSENCVSAYILGFER